MCDVGESSLYDEVQPKIYSVLKHVFCEVRSCTIYEREEREHRTFGNCHGRNILFYTRVQMDMYRITSLGNGKLEC